jgi:hypothetical protein
MQKKYTTPRMPDSITFPSVDRRLREAVPFPGMRREEQFVDTLKACHQYEKCTLHSTRSDSCISITLRLRKMHLQHEQESAEGLKFTADVLFSDEWFFALTEITIIHN